MLLSATTLFLFTGCKSEVQGIFPELEYDEMVFVEGGTFTMGATSEQDSYHYSDELPTHQVTLRDFYIGKYEVTQQMWEYVMNYTGTCANGSIMTAYSSGPWLGSSPLSMYGAGDYYPAYLVSWNDVVNVFLPRLNRITGKNYRLPTEAEWEYAARGGNMSKGYKYSGSNNLDSVAWYDDSFGGAKEVGQKQPNELGLYDMSGNVREWCSDLHGNYCRNAQTNPTGPASGSDRVRRGGSWRSSAYGCRVSNRHYHRPAGPINRGFIDIGFRLVLDVELKYHRFKKSQ